MPKNAPTVAEAWEEITFFSIDTNLIQKEGYNFGQGALHLLPKQLPESIGLQLPEIVVTEIVKHRMEPVEKAYSGLKGSADELHRLTKIDTSSVHSSIEQLNAMEAAKQLFTKQVHDYAVQCRGAVLPTAGASAAESMFADYFAQRPPFGKSEKRKSEFPDAMCLWLLEQYAKEKDTIGVIASDDNGWKEYAARSQRLYCVGSIEELANLFVATTEHSKAIKEMIARAVADASSTLGFALAQELEGHVANSEWDCSEIYSGSSYSVEAEFTGAEVVEHEIAGDINIWSVEGERTTWVVELTASLKLNVHVSVEFFAWDSIDRDEISIGSHDFTTQEDLEVDVYVTCANVHLDSMPSSWITDIEIADGSYSINAFEVEMEYGGPDE